MNTVRICPSCKKPLPADAPAGLCPECLVRVGLGSGVDPGAAPSGAPAPAAPAAGFTEPPSLDEVARLFPQLEILELLGQGGMGVVYKARQKNLDRLVALKIMLPQFSRDPAFVERFNREARALARLNHPNIVAVYDFGQTGDAAAPLCFFIMEFVDGANLRHLIQSGKLTAPEALAIVPKICEALQFAHDEGVVHRDIKPANILIDKRGRVKIADFGLAKLAGATDVSLTRSQQGMGTPQYMAPEQLENARSVDHRADIYSLGVVFYEMLTGELPLGRFEPPSRRVQVDVRLDEIVLKALEKSPERRYQQASEVKSRVETVAGSVAMPAPAGSGPVPQPEVTSSAAAPRLSRAAILGAVWAWFAPIAVVAAYFFAGMDRVSSGAAKPTDLIHEQPPIAFTIFMGALLAVGAGAPIGTTILGAVSIGNIKRSGGRLCGLPLAFADAVFFPMLILYALVAIPFGLAVALIFKLPSGPGEILIFGSLPALAVCFLTGRAIWRKVNPTSAAPISTAHSKPLDHRVSEAVTVGLPGWFHGRARWVQLVIEVSLLLVFMFGLVSLLSFQISQSPEAVPGSKVLRTVTTVRLGTPSPWLTAEFGGLKHGISLHWFASSLWIGVVGAAAAWLYEFLRRSRPGFDVEADRRRQRKWWIIAAAVCGVALALFITVFTLGARRMDNSARAVSDRATDQMATTVTTNLKPESAAINLLRQVSEKYGRLSSFSASGRVVTSVAGETGGTTVALGNTFSLNLARPDFYRLTWTNSARELGGAMDGAVWSAGDGHKQLLAGRVAGFLNRETALATATGVSGGVAGTVPGLFFKDERGGLPEHITNATVQPEESIGAELCHVISGDAPGRKVTVWISKKDLLLRQFRSVNTPDDSLAAARAEAGQMSAESLRKFFKSLGRDYSLETVTNLMKRMDTDALRASRMPITTTEIYERIAVNELMVKEDFEVTVPVARAAPKRP
jgi:tRNA A-37 threonylcarbamoyl transferase component Bud32